MIVAQGHDGPGNQDAVIAAAPFQDLFQAGRQGQDGLAGAGLAHQGHHLDILIQQQIQSELLLLVQRLDAIDRLAVMRQLMEPVVGVSGQRRF